MADDLLQQAAAQAPAVAGGGAVGGGAIIAALKLFKVFASPQDVDVVKADFGKQIAELRAEMAEKYLGKDALAPLFDEIRHVRERIDLLFEQRK